MVGSWEYPEQISTVMVTFVHATFFLLTFVHIRNFSSSWFDFDETLKIGFWEHVEHIPTVMVTFVQANEFLLLDFLARAIVGTSLYVSLCQLVSQLVS